MKTIQLPEVSKPADKMSALRSSSGRSEFRAERHVEGGLDRTLAGRENVKERHPLILDPHELEFSRLRLAAFGCELDADACGFWILLFGSDDPNGIQL